MINIIFAYKKKKVVDKETKAISYPIERIDYIIVDTNNNKVEKHYYNKEHPMESVAPLRNLLSELISTGNKDYTIVVNNYSNDWMTVFEKIFGLSKDVLYDMNVTNIRPMIELFDKKSMITKTEHLKDKIKRVFNITDMAEDINDVDVLMIALDKLFKFKQWALKINLLK